MKRFSVKLKMTGWLTILMAVLSLLLLLFMLSMSNEVASTTAMTQLSETVRSNLQQVKMVDDTLQFGEGFAFSRNGVSTLVYNKNKALLAGQVPVAFTADEAFQNGLTRLVSTGEERYMVMDLWLPLGWEDGLWVRGLMEVPAQQGATRNLIRMAMVALPVFILLAALGSYRIAKRAFRPLDSITATAAAINEAKDLSGRIALSPGRDEFSRLAATFDHMFERLEQSFEAEKQFTADASHELRTPLSIIKGACEYAEKYDETPEERQETITMIHRQAVKMTDLITQLLRMTRLDQGTELLTLEWLDLGALVRTCCREQTDLTSGLHLELQDGIMVRADAALLSRLIQNLLENAVKYGRPGGGVWVSVGQTERTCLLSVRDDGIGIEKEAQAQIWQRFYQVDPARSGQSGVGLGLAMVRQIAQAHGGSMTLESVPDVGSVFTLHLPKPDRGELS